MPSRFKSYQSVVSLRVILKFVWIYHNTCLATSTTLAGIVVFTTPCHASNHVSCTLKIIS